MLQCDSIRFVLFRFDSLQWQWIAFQMCTTFSFFYPYFTLYLCGINRNLGNNIFPKLPKNGLKNVLHLKTFNNPKLRDFPAPETFPRIQVSCFFFVIGVSLCERAHKCVTSSIFQLPSSDAQKKILNDGHDLDRKLMCLRYSTLITCFLLHVCSRLTIFFCVIRTDAGAVIRVSLLRFSSPGDNDKHTKNATATRSRFVSNWQWIRYELVEQQSNGYLAAIA